jgi:hypothetical protein
MSQPTSNTPTSKEELLARLRAQRERTLSQLGNAGGSVAPRSEPSPVPSVPAPEPAPAAPVSAVALAMLAKKAAALRAQQEAAAEAERIANLPPPKAPELACKDELRERCPELAAACQSLATALLQQEPQLGQFLADIHEHLRAEPELMHILTDEQIAATYKGFIAQSGKQIIAAKPKSAAAAKKAIAMKEAEDDGL